MESKENKSVYYSKRFLKHIKNIIKESEDEIGKTDQLESIYKLFEIFNSRKKTDHSDVETLNEEDEVESDEKTERLRRVIEFVQSNSSELNQEVTRAKPDINNNYQSSPQTPPHSSDEEVEENFYQELLHMFMNASNFNQNPMPDVNFENGWHEKK